MSPRMVSTLCIKEPYATMTVDGFKTAEIRSRPTNHRGELLVVASLSPDIAALRKWMTYADRIPMYRLGLAIGFVWVEDCIPFTPDLESKARIACSGVTKKEWAWMLDPKKARFIEPFAVHGRLGIFKTMYEEVVNVQ